MSKIPFFKFFSKSKFSVSNVNKYYVGVKPQPTLNCVGRIEKRFIKNSPCHPEHAAPLVADEKEAYKGGCSQSISGSSRCQKCSTICTVSGKEVLDKVGWAFSPTMKLCWGRNPNLQKAISYASRTAQRHVRGDLVPAFTLAEVFSPYYYSPRRIAFTLAEVLITLGIIGVVAAMTLPVLTANYRKSVIETRLAKFYSVINQAIMQSEVENGSRLYWNRMEVRNQDDVVTTEGISPKEWYETYLKKYLKTLKVEESGTIERRFDVYFTDGSMVSFSGSGWVFFPYAKDYATIEKESGDGLSFEDIDRESAGTKSFNFLFRAYDSSNKYLYKKGVEPYILRGWDGTRESLFTNSAIGCQKNVSNTRAYCTALIFLNGWKIPKDYPLKL